MLNESVSKSVNKRLHEEGKGLVSQCMNHLVNRGLNERVRKEKN